MMEQLPPLPSFLDRRGEKPRRIVTRKPQTVTRKPGPELVDIHLEDQAPRIGSGRRQVEVVTIGHKWVTVRSWPGGPQCEPVRHKFKRADWERIKK